MVGSVRLSFTGKSEEIGCLSFVMILFLSQNWDEPILLSRCPC